MVVIRKRAFEGPALPEGYDKDSEVNAVTSSKSLAINSGSKEKGQAYKRKRYGYLNDAPRS